MQGRNGMKAPVEIDSVDRKILVALQKDARMSYQAIAERLRISTGTVHNRIKKLTEQGVLGEPKANIQIEALGHRLHAFIGVTLKEASKMETVQRKLTAIPQVLESYYTTGEFSLICKLVVRETSELYAILTERIQRIAEIQSTYTYVVLETLLHRELSLDKIETSSQE
jgi:Lrp/AsnC family transcriptional regulator for asnA, asnC and gidA